ncbi:MAG TPA: MFS transporter [Acidimicrobiales bacterium]|nr:MFS transporter [Acidimicrobiales bacterium]
MTATRTDPAARPGRDGGAHWAMVGSGAALIGTCYGLARFAYGLFAPEFAEEFSIGSTLSGVIGSGSYVGYCIAIVASLVLTPRWGPRRVAVLAGVFATVGMSVVALAPSAAVLAIGILIAGSSTGIASPPLAAAVGAWVRAESRDRAQTMVNAGTGFGVLISGPVALVLMDQWRWAWASFAVLAAIVTCWVHIAVPARADVQPQRSDSSPTARRLAPGTQRLLLASFLMGLSSIAVWTFGRELITSQGDAAPLVSAITWTVLGTAGVLGAAGGDLVQRVGLATSWLMLMLTMGAATALFAFAPSTTALVLVAAALFGSSYLGLTGLVLVWSTRLYPDRTSFGVGLSFFTVAAGQAVGALLVGRLTESISATTVFYIWAALAILGGAVLPQRSAQPVPPI